MVFPKTLHTLAIEHCALRRLSLQVTTLTALTALNLGYNNLTELPKSFTALQNLKRLDLSHNSFENFPLVLASECFSKNLIFLDMKDNYMVSLSPEFTKLSALISINLNCNRLEYLPEGIGLMKSLVSVMVSNNMLELLPCSLVTRVYHKADFSENPFTLRIPPGGYERERGQVASLRELAGQSVISHG
ncbi:leucine-rich repeat protein 1-like [Elysia marginata]|uniref:Leucine-rich repeat protein 1-like n=1 Tax=Elysia marginata TaxID=1093978 RepID=A0AAV4H3Y5_9GAST|nr:leucine-rich repeat protein 1-like [Elysia marginata]